MQSLLYNTSKVRKGLQKDKGLDWGIKKQFPKYDIHDYKDIIIPWLKFHILNGQSPTTMKTIVTNSAQV